MRKLKKIVVVSIQWVKSVGYLLYWFILNGFKSDYRNHIKKEKQVRAIDVIVNGPSFVKQKDTIKNNIHDKIMVNYAANSSFFWELKPKYYCVSDPSFWKKAIETEEGRCFLGNIMKIDWDMIFFVTYYDYRHHIRNTEIEKFNHIKFVPFHSTRIPFSFRLRKIAFMLFSAGQAMPNPESVSIPIIMIAINLGYSKIFLYGYDQDWIHNVVVDESNRVCFQDTHFYNEKGVLLPWIKDGNTTFRMYEILRSQTSLFESYWFIREYMNYLGNVSIINMSPISLIDAFEKNRNGK